MNIKRAKQEIKDSIEAYLTKDDFGEYEIPVIRQRPILLLGAPGIGKTQIMEQIARELRIGLVSYTITHHTRQSAIGLPFISERSYGGKKQAVTEYTMSEIVASIYDKMEYTGLREGILFIDEINCVSETLAPAMLQFLQCKTFGSHAIPRGWIIVAAGNPPEYNKSVREFDVVTMDRVKKILVEPDLGVWKEYAYGEGIHPAVLSYLGIRPAYFYQMEQTVEGRQFVTPRGWEDLSRLLYVYEKLGKCVDREVAAQYVQHPKVARDFAGYLELYGKYRGDYQIEEIFRGNISEGILKKVGHSPFDERLSLISILLDYCGELCRRAVGQEQYLTVLLEELSVFKKTLLEGTGKGEVKAQGKDSPKESRPGYATGLLEERLQEVRERREKGREAEILSRREERTLYMAAGALKRCIKELSKDEPSGREAAFERVQAWFAKENEEYRKLCHRAGEALERAFDFMEAAFGESQEMTVFLTELNTNGDMAAFLQTYECPRYYQYNRSLLLEEGHAALRRRIEEL